jgi:hypothetical protein
MAKRRHRPSWFDTAGRVIGLLSKAASLIESIRRIF